MKERNDVISELQADDSRPREMRVNFDFVFDINFTLEARIHVYAHTIHKAIFEFSVVKVQENREEDLKISEKHALRIFSENTKLMITLRSSQRISRNEL